MNRTWCIALILALTWLLWSGHTETQMLVFGLVSVAAVLGIVRRMDRFSETERDKLLGLRTLTYLPWLLWEILKSNLEVCRIILSPRLPITPTLIRVGTSQQTATGKVIYANSITLTPGTISLDLRDDTILVHALTQESAAGVATGEMDRRVSHLEKDA